MMHLMPLSRINRHFQTCSQQLKNYHNRKNLHRYHLHCRSCSRDSMEQASFQMVVVELALQSHRPPLNSSLLLWNVVST
jgi:hypothetical protein